MMTFPQQHGDLVDGRGDVSTGPGGGQYLIHIGKPDRLRHICQLV
jgi:hypothetical protein